MSDDEEQQRLNEKSTLEREIFGGSDDEEDDLDDIENFRLSDEEDEGKHLDDDYGADKRTPKGGKSKGRSQETSPGRDRDSVSPAPSGPPLPKFKKRRGDDIEPGKSKVKKQRRERKRKGGDRLEDRDEAPPRELSPESQKMEEAKRDFEEALKKIKPRRVKKGDLPDEAEIDEMMARILAKMKEAADNDQELNQQKQPAIAKLKLLPSVVEQLSKPQLMEQFLENHILEGIKFWLEPLKGDASLPSLDIQRAMFRALLE
ncbi:Transcription factor iws1, partial [Quaeritorhiza haematococci]